MSAVGDTVLVQGVPGIITQVGGTAANPTYLVNWSVPQVRWLLPNQFVDVTSPGPTPAPGPTPPVSPAAMSGGNPVPVAPGGRPR
jgi:hypothetical protein